MSQKGKKCKVSLQTKLKIIEAAQQQASYTSIMKEFNICNKSTVAMILKNKEKYIAAAQKTNLECHRISSFSRYPEVDSDIEHFIFNCVRNSHPINVEILRKEAKKCAQNHGYTDFPASNGYLEKFLKKKRRLDSAVVTNAMQDWAGKLLPQMVEGYSRDDVFNGDEFSLSYRNIPKRMHRSLEEQGRYNTEKVTVFVAANWSSSDKLQLVVIGKSKHPVCLKNKEAPIIYRSSQTGLMTREVFEDVMVLFNEHFKQQGRKVLFLVDMCDEHKLLTLSNLKVDFWPPAAAAKLQPLQQGIIPLLRENYQRLFTEKVLLLTEEGEVPAVRKLTLFDTSFMLHSLWEQVEKDQIAEAFLQAGFPDSNVSLAVVDAERREICKTSVAGEDALQVTDLCQHSFNVPCAEEAVNSSVEEDGVPSTTGLCKDNLLMSSALVKDSVGTVDHVSGEESPCLSSVNSEEVTDVTFSALQVATLGNGCPTEVGSLTLVEDVSSPLHSVTITAEKDEATALARRSLSNQQFVDAREASLLMANITEAVDETSQQLSGTYSRTGHVSGEKAPDFSMAQKALQAVRGYVSSRGAPEAVLDMVSGIETFLKST